MHRTIILIGPEGVGKSSVSDILSKRLNLPMAFSDYFVRTRINESKKFSTLKALYYRLVKGFWTFYKYIKPFEADVVVEVLNKTKNGIIDFGAGHSVFDDEKLFDRVKKAFEPHRFVFLLLPSPDLDKSIKILNDANPHLLKIKPNITEHFIKSKCNYELAKYVIYTKDKLFDKVAQEIIDIILKEERKKEE